MSQNGIFKIRGFMPYLVVAFLNACVDLAHKITIQNTLMKSYDGNELIILTAIVNSMILIPFVLLFSPAGFISDKFDKTRVIRIAALFSVGISVAVLASYIAGLFWVAFILTLILAAQSAIYSPAKYGLIKSIVGVEKLGQANGIVQALTVVAILSGSFIFSFAFESLYGGVNTPEQIVSNIWIIGIFLVLFSAGEAFFAFRLPEYGIEKDSAQNQFDFKKYISLKYLMENMKIVRQDRNIWLSIIGLSLFWGVSQVVVAAFPAHYKATFGDDNTIIVQGILALSGLGMIVGSWIAGSLSKHHIEHGIIPVGALGICISLFIFATHANAVIMGGCSFLFGLCGGFLLVPLNATIQYLAPEKQMGKIIAGNNFIQNIFMIAFLVASVVLVEITKTSTTGLFLTIASICLMSGIYAIFQVPHLFTRILLLPILKTNYRFNVDGLQNLPQRGGVLLLGNHISWIDWLVLQAASPRAIKFVMYRGIYNKKYLTWLFKFFNVIPIGKGASKDSFTEIRTRLENGEVVALFPEGHISYNGQINEFQKGYELAIQNMENICIVPFYLRGLWGSSFSRAESYYKELTKKHAKRDIIVAFGKPINRFADHIEMKQKVVELSFSSWEHFLSRQQPFMNNWLANVKNDLFKTAAVDSTGMNLNNLKFATGVFSFVKVFKQLLEKEETVGVLLPGSTAAAIVNMALFIMGKVPVNLNYTLNPQSMEAALKKASINKIITSEKFLTKLEGRGFSFKELLDGKTIYAEQVGSIISKGEKIKTLLAVLLLPTNLLKLIYFTPTTLDDTATILFSSGSEGEPKGIELSHKNILANIKQISDLINFKKSDAILNSLPVFHSFGLTVTTLMPLCEGLKMISVPDPTDGAAIGKMAAQHHATVIFGTSTFFRLYARNKKLHPLMFQSVRLIVAGAEKLKPEVKEAFKLKFGHEIYEGYGATETAPVAAVNTPNILDPETLRELTFNRLGSVGLPLPGTVIKIIDPETMQEMATGEDGLIVIGGSQVMKGYLNDSDKTAEVICEIDGIRYYKTGDKGHIDEQGFVFITDRYSRFAKIGGEMISLGSVEENITRVLGDEAPFCAVNVPDDKKGEAIALLIKTDKTPAEIAEKLKQSDLIPLMMPTHILPVENLPILGSGKADFKGAKKMAVELLAGSEE
ncbi:MAG: acyl-[Neisseriaceae bacterium]|nr:acyl-[ACP]--phospholipid O-acyltransferase [Neisseriaceae bacterium]